MQEIWAPNHHQDDCFECRVSVASQWQAMAEATASFVIGVPGFRHSKAFSVKIRLQSTSAMPKFRNATF